MNVLICLLGLSPGVATSAYYALARDRGIRIDRLITVSTKSDLIERSENEVAEELRHWLAGHADWPQVDYPNEPPLKLPPLQAEEALTNYRDRLSKVLCYDQFGTPRSQPPARLRIADDDVVDAASTAALRELLLVLVRDIYASERDNVYICTAGGRKSMAAIAMLAAQLGPRVQRLFHVHNTAPNVERLGSVEHADLRAVPTAALRPTKDQLLLVDIPFFRIGLSAAQPELFLPLTPDQARKPDAFILELLRQHEAYVVLDPAAEEEFIAGFFEERVQAWLQDQGYQARRNPRPEWLAQHGVQVSLGRPDPTTGQRTPNQVDVAGVRDREVVLIECKAYLSRQTVKEGDLAQALHLLESQVTDPAKQLRVYLATTAQGLADPADWQRAGMEQLTIWKTSTALADEIRTARIGKKWRRLLAKAETHLQLSRLEAPTDGPAEGKP